MLRRRRTTPSAVAVLVTEGVTARPAQPSLVARLDLATLRR
jgi:hypothetical protein